MVVAGPVGLPREFQTELPHFAHATVEAFDKLHRACAVFIAHDLDKDNRFLLSKGRLSAVLHHDLNQDMRRACHLIMQVHHALPGAVRSMPSSIQVITPYNVPTLDSYDS